MPEFVFPFKQATQPSQEGKESDEKTSTVMSLQTFVPLAVLAVSLLISSAPFAGEVKKLAVLVPEQGTDCGGEKAAGIGESREPAHCQT